LRDRFSLRGGLVQRADRGGPLLALRGLVRNSDQRKHLLGFFGDGIDSLSGKLLLTSGRKDHRKLSKRIHTDRVVRDRLGNLDRTFALVKMGKLGCDSTEKLEAVLAVAGLVLLLRPEYRESFLDRFQSV